jgi:hypothetical protein
MVRQRVFCDSGWACGICHEPVDAGLRFPHPLAATVDHIVPRFFGGTDEIGNLQCAHYVCNAYKSAPGWAEAIAADPTHPAHEIYARQLKGRQNAETYLRELVDSGQVPGEASDAPSLDRIRRQAVERYEERQRRRAVQPHHIGGA